MNTSKATVRMDEPTAICNVVYALQEWLDVAQYAMGKKPPNYPVPAIDYYGSFDKKHFDLQYVMLCSDEFVEAIRNVRGKPRAT